MAHIDAGKTTTTERILYYTGRAYKIGEVNEGTATMDCIGADFYQCIDLVRERLGAHPVAVQIPIGREDQYRGLVDLIDEVGLVWTDDDDSLGKEFTKIEVPADMREQVKEYREKMIEGLAEVDEHLMEKYVHGEPITPAELKAAVRKGTISMKLFPVLCGASFKNKGVQPLLDAVIDYLPSPLDIPPIQGINPETKEVEERKAADDAPFAALAFKIMNDQHVGQLVFLHVYSGTLEAGSGVYNSTKARKERVGRLLRMHANKNEDVEAVAAGDIAAAIGLKLTTTGDTLCDG